MMLSSIFVLLFTNPSSILGEMITSSQSSLKLCVQLCAIYAVWLGIMELVDASGLSEKLARFLRPLIKRIFRVENPETQKYIALNMSANILGLGGAATPMGIRAMQSLDDKTGNANFAIIMLIVVNSTSIQLLPSTVIGLRQSAGSLNPADIIFPTLIATCFTTICGILFVQMMDKLKKRRKQA